MEVVEKMRYRAALSLAFSPSAPVRTLDLFSGRGIELDRITDAVLQRGKHAAIYGERGVGKTSLANVLPDKLGFLAKFNYKVVRHNCSTISSFGSMWEGVFRELSFKRLMGNLDETTSSTIPINRFLPPEPGPEDVRLLLQESGTPNIIIFDEFDRAPKDCETSGLLADTIKSLSDHAVDTTLIIIGVADSIDELISEHKSIERALVQIKMPRMSESELLSILESGFKHADMQIDINARWQIAAFAQGLPHNVHELGLFTGYAALDSDRLNADMSDVDPAIKQATENAQQTIVVSYSQATSSPHQNIFKEILLAAALARKNDLGYFSAGDLRNPLAAIMQKNYGIDAYMRHLNSFCEESRGRLLEKKGEKRRYLFRFSEPILEPYVIMRGVAEGLIPRDKVLEIQSSNLKANPLSLF